ncbi:MAG: DUF4760 domain-containing protein [Terriglobales bacterium]
MSRKRQEPPLDHRRRFATTDDAQVILYLYDLRRDAEMRQARHFISADFWPQTAEDVLQLARSYPSRENGFLRQVTTYWEMAASFVLRGALDEQLFFDSSGEMYCVFAKFSRLLPGIRQKLPYFLVNVENVIQRTAGGPERLQRLEAKLTHRQQKLAQRRAAVAATSAGYS